MTRSYNSNTLYYSLCELLSNDAINTRVMKRGIKYNRDDSKFSVAFSASCGIYYIYNNIERVKLVTIKIIQYLINRLY